MAAVRAWGVQATLVGDAHVSSALPAVNSGALSNLNVGAGYTALVQFDLGVLPAGTTAAEVTRATLRVYCNRVDAAGQVAVQMVNGAWSEGTVTYATLPSLGTALQSAQVATAGGFVTFDVTQAVQGWAGGSANNGLALTANSSVAVQFDSKENDETGHAPELEIALVAGTAGPAGAAGATGATGATGAQGLAGPAGPIGPIGAAGAAGVAGVAGPKGATGATGAAGLPGATGAQGSPGTSGAFAFAGSYSSLTNYALGDVVSFAGSSYVSLLASNHGNTPGLTVGTWGLLAQQGAQGLAGATGATGAAGQQGPAGYGVQGAIGATGVAGATGATGSPGLVYQGNYSSITNYALGDVAVFQGSSYASLVAANHGNTPALSPAYWGILTAQGPSGAMGVAGPVGATGMTGALGPVGPPGDRGETGAQGTAGQAGAQGIPGTTGTTGLQGPAGPQGLAGPVGLSFLGAYDPAANYSVGDGVLWQGAGWVSLVASNHGNTPSLSPTNWAMFAASGAVGATGATGAVGVAGLNGLPGAPGAAGATGATGATGSTGSAGLVYRGDYASATNYALGDVVVFQGASWASLQSFNVGQTPGISVGYWGVLTSIGPQGPVGTTGAIGPQGVQGVQGLLGPAGPQGLVGSTGIQGPAGAQGLPGATGAVGATGAQGLQGTAGQAGAQGIPGITGATGLQGPAGPTGLAGATGVAGAAGAVGPAGTPGLVWQGAWTSATNYALNDVVSYAGASWVSVAAGNAGQAPNVSPSYWQTVAAQGLAGPQGIAGPIGPFGPVGATGGAGPQGPQGIAGPQGTQGPAGAQGLAGTTGPAGAAGAQGLQGIAGQAGAQGISGATGPQGAQGLAGPQGVAGATGSTGATGTAGAVGMNFRGAWNAVTNYAVNDAVTFAGSTYLAQMQGSNAEPDMSPQSWAVLAQAGGPGATGAQGQAATVQVGSVTTLAAGASATVTNVGTSQASVLNFGIPQGATGAAGTGGPGGPTVAGNFGAVYHPVSYNTKFYSVNLANASLTETDGSVLTWVPLGCTATRLDVYSQQSGAIKVTLRQGAAGSLADTALVCSAATNNSCTVSGSVAVGAGTFLDLRIDFASGTTAAVWTAVQCQ